MDREILTQEDYSPRGLGSNWHPCYICNQGGGDSVQTDMTAVVDNRESGQRIVRMFKALDLHPVLDYRDNQPHHVQVKLGACEEHVPNLRKLYVECQGDNKINIVRINESLTV